MAHLVRQANGPAALSRFLAAYDRHPGGAPHDLVLICKGFTGGTLDPGHARVVAGRTVGSFHVPDRGFDVVPYLRAARALPYAHFCFLNSFSRPLDPGWLAKLYDAARVPGVGLAGATGSWETMAAERARLRRLRWADLSRLRGRARLAFARRLVPRLAEDLAYWAAFPPFPAPHVRTNALVVARHHLLTTAAGVRVGGKFDAWRFEHGRRSLTRRLAGLGLRAVVVGRDGRSYGPAEWDRSGTFWQADQANLLVADNQTDRYADATPAGRAALSAGAWGRSP